MKSRNTFVLGILAFGICIGICAYRAFKNADKPSHAVENVSSPIPAVENKKSSVYEERDRTAANLKREIAQRPAKSADGFTYRLNLYRQYAKKVLKTEVETQLFHDLIGNEEMQDLALRRFTSDTDEDTRLSLVDFLIDGMDEQARAGQTQLRIKVSDFLQAALPTEHLNKKMIQSLAADRIELFTTLQQIDPQMAARLAANPKSELNKRIFQYASANYGKKGG